MKKYSLNGVWDLYYFKENTLNITSPEELIKSDVPKIKGKVPGNCELDLSDAGILPKDLFMGENIRKLKEFEEYEYWYVTEFKKPDLDFSKKVCIEFDGVDCLAEYWLNGAKIGESDNMFIPVSFDVTDKLMDKNILAVKIRSVISDVYSKDDYPQYSLNFTQPTENLESVLVRKAPHSFGWDIMPRAVTSGIWKSVNIVAHEENDIKYLFCVAKEVTEKSALVDIGYEINTLNVDGIEIEISGRCKDSTFNAREKIYFKAGRVKIQVENPYLWWPYGYGDANLYDIEVKLYKNNEQVSCEKTKMGIRSVTLKRTDITDGVNGDFQFYINNVPVIAKGTNWICLDVFHSQDHLRLKKGLEMVKDIGCNIVRCWGGNVYETKEFYDFCDANGIMVWQDFAMACHAYPQDEEFLNKMKKEAAWVVKFLRNHPSVILWSGDNECDVFIYLQEGDPNDNLITREILPRAILENDGTRPYLPSSPYFSEEVMKNGGWDFVPENHLWGPRDYFKSPFYTNYNCHFISETGYHGCPSLKSIEKFIDKEYIWPIYDNPQWNLHSTDMKGRDHRVMLMEKQVRQLFGEMPDNIEDFIFASQISQAEAKKFFIENVRVKRETKKGIMWWNLLDGWPQMSDAVVDYYFEKKIAYDYIKRSQQPFSIMFGEIESWDASLFAVNDTLEEKKGKYKVSDIDSGKEIAAGEFKLKPNSSEVLKRIPLMYSEKGMFLIEWEIDGERYINHYLYGTPKFELSDYKKWYNLIK